jgi:RNA polymerase sigma factor (sigma-70 family)
MYWLGHKSKPQTAEKQLALVSEYQKTVDDAYKVILRNELIKSNYGTIVSIAKKYKKAYFLYSQDMFNEGVLGLCKAIEKYNPSFGCSFTTYANYYINLDIITFVKHNSRSVTITEHANYKLQKMKDKNPDNPDFKTRQILELYTEDEQFDPLMHFDSTVDMEGAMLKENRSNVINEILKSFPVKEKLVLRCRYNLNNLKRMSLHEIGSFFQITSECVRQIERKALKRLRARLVKLNIVERGDFIDD